MKIGARKYGLAGAAMVLRELICEFGNGIGAVLQLLGRSGSQYAFRLRCWVLNFGTSTVKPSLSELEGDHRDGFMRVVC